MFQFPSNGKAYHKQMRGMRTKEEEGFNSLQTGKRITRLWKSVTLLVQKEGFQFPSNGKAYHKTIPAGQLVSEEFVSIPFKRESVSQGSSIKDRRSPRNSSFNSLQTGKRITRVTVPHRLVLVLQFQFPSNGKAYHKTMKRFKQFLLRFVSIPFKRESVSQATRSTS